MYQDNMRLNQTAIACQFTYKFIQVLRFTKNIQTEQKLKSKSNHSRL